MRRKIALFWGIFLLFVLLPVRSFAAGNGTGTSDAFNASAAAAGAQVSGSIIDAITRDFNGESSMQESEPNDDLSHSDYIPDNTATSGLVHGKESGYNEDYYSFRVSARTEVRIAGICDENTTCIFLLDASGKYLKRVNADMMYEGEYLHTFYSKIVLDAGVYHLWVKNDVYPYFTGYSIWLDAVECAHANLTSATVAPTCTEDGYIRYTCTDCIYFRDEKNADALGHLDENPAVTAPTCTMQGYTSHKCTRCGYTWKDSYVSAPGHTEVTDAAVPATCTKTGLTQGSHCSICGTILQAQAETDATGHTESILVPAVAPTCEQTGLAAKSECSVCGTVLSNRKTVPALGHTAVRKPYKAPTCSGTGLTAGSSCSVCGKELTAQKTIPMLPHTEVESPTVAATCTETGRTGGTHCDVCHTSLSESTVIPALGHRKVIIYPATEPTCTGSGATESSYCGVCGETLQSQYSVKALGHNYVDNVCTRCGKNSTNWTWELSDNTLTISGTGSMTDFYEYIYNSSSWFSPPWADNRTSIKTVIIEEGITGIGNYAFSSCTGLTRVYLPNSLTDIGDYAFSGCTSLSSITLPGNLTGIGNYAFNECTSLSSITLPDSMTSVGNYAFYQCSNLSNVTLPGSLTSISSYMFANCDRLYRIVLPEGVTEIQSYAFYSCDRLNYVGLPDSLTIIGSSVFAYCTNLSSITLPDNLDVIGDSAFAGCTYLSSVTFPERMTSLGGGLFYECTVLKSVTLPDGPTSLGTNMFTGCTKLSSVTLPDTLTEIGYGTFDKCPNIKSIDIPDGVTSIGTYAFRYCTLLSSLIMPTDLESIGEYVFQSCVNLNRIVMTGDAPQIDYHAFSGLSTSIYYPADKKGWSNVITYQYGGKITWIHDVDHIYAGICVYGENWKYDITTATLTISKADRQYGTHQGWPWKDRGWEIEKLVVEYGVTGIPYDLLKNCTSLTSISLPSSLTGISSNAFAGCTGLTQITLPAKLTSVGSGAFSGCTGLDSITFLGSAPTSIGTEPFARANAVVYFSGEDGTWTEDVIAQLGSGLLGIPRYSGPGTCGENLTWEYDSVSRTLTISGTGAMDDFYGVGGAPWYAVHALADTVVIDDGVTAIGSYAFHNFTELTGIILPEHLTVIGDSAFRNCSSLGSIAIAYHVEQIGVTAFADCTGISEITFQGGAPESIGDNAFYEVTATVSYPGQNPGWTEELRQDYGGNLTWNGYTCENHQAVPMKEVLPTCTRPGLTGGRYCFVCETVLTEQTEVPAAGHTEVTDPAVEATCIRTGLTEGRHCSVCETVFLKQEVVPTTAHTEVTDPAAEPTCSKTGLTEGKHCSVCKTVLVKQETVPVTAHLAMGPNQMLVPAETLEADCTNGVVCFHCSNVVKAPLGHRVIVRQSQTEAPFEVINDSAVPFVLTEETHYSSNHTHSSSSILTFKVTAGSTLTLHYGVSSEKNYDKLTIALNGTVMDTISGLVDNQTLTLNVTAGDTITVTYSKDSSLSKNDDSGWVSVQYEGEAGDTVVPAESLEATCQEIVCDFCQTVVREGLGHHVVLTPTGAGAPFEVINTSSVPFVLTDGNYYSNNRTSNSSSSLRFKVNYNCTLTLDYGVSSEASYDKLTIKLNSIVKNTISGLLDNQSLTLNVTAGDTVTVTYSKDSSVSSNDDRGWVSVQYAPEIIPADAVDPGCYDIPCYYCQQIVIPGVGHVETAIPAVEPDCTKTGLTEGKRCSVCNTVLEEQQVVPAKGHTEVIVPAVEATCTEPGLTEGGHCSVCNTVLEEQQMVPARGHTEKVDPAVEAACTEPGLTEGSHCSACEEVLIAQETIPAKGHFAMGPDGTLVPADTLEPDCANAIVCTVCEEVVKEALGHRVILQNPGGELPYEVSNKSDIPFVLIDGKYYSNNHSNYSHISMFFKVRRDCILTLNYGVSSEPKYDKLIISLNNAILHSIAGLVDNQTLTLNVTAGDTIMVSYSKNENTRQNEDRGWVSVQHGQLVPAETVEAGCVELICYDCQQVVKEAQGHKEIVIPAVEATCTEPGLTEGKRCSVCDVVLAEPQIAPAKGHTEAITPAVEPTCTQTGLTEGKHCSACETVFATQEIIPAKGHFAMGPDGTQVPADTLEPDCVNAVVCTVCEEVVKEALGHRVPLHQSDENALYQVINNSPSPFVLTDNTYYSSNHVLSSVSYLYFKVNSSYTLVLNYGVSSEPKYDNLIIKLNRLYSTTLDTISGLVDNKQLSLDVTAGDVIAVSYSTDSSVAQNEDRGWVSVQPVVPADAVEAGCLEILCYDCQQVAKEALGHNWDAGVEKVPATETSEGEMFHTCQRCGETKTETIPVLEHIHHYESVVTPPTCETPGYTTHTCICGHSYTDNPVEASGHTEITDDAVEATCTQSGLTEGRHCSVCGAVLVKQEVISARGHTIPEDEWHSDKHGHWQQCGICGEQMEHEPHSIEGDGNNPSCTVCGFRIGALKDLGWFFEKLNDPDHYLWATGNYARIIEKFGR